MIKFLEEQNKFFKDKTISVVGNGSSTLENDYSKEIDNSDIVIRMNHGGILYKDYPQMGKKLNIYATNSYTGQNISGKKYTEILNYIENLSNDKIIMTTRPLRLGLQHGLFTNKPFSNLFSKIDNKIIEISQDIFLKNKIGNFYNFSSGASILLYLNEFNFKTLKVFGFDNFKTKYFFNQNVKSTLGGHNGDMEQKVIEIISKEKNVKHYGNNK